MWKQELLTQSMWQIKRRNLSEAVGLFSALSNNEVDEFLPYFPAPRTLSPHRGSQGKVLFARAE